MWLVAFRRLDDLIMDRMSQPIVNRLQRHPLDVALHPAIGATVLMSIACLTNLIWTNSQSLMMISVIAAATQGYALWTFRRMSRMIRPMIRPGYRNPLREVARIVRLMITILVGLMCLTDFCLTILVGVSNFMADITGLAAIMACIGGIGWMFNVYLGACDYPPMPAIASAW